MDKDELYHAGWTHRKFFSPRPNKQNSAKHPRVTDPIEQMAQEEMDQATQHAGHEQAEQQAGHEADQEVGLEAAMQTGAQAGQEKQE